MQAIPGCPLASRRMKLRTFWSALPASIHWKPLGALVELPQRRHGRVERAEVDHQMLHAGVRRVVEQRPVERRFVRPLVLVAELAAHEEELLAGVRPHPAEHGAEVREALPWIAGHLAEQRSLEVHDLVVGEREDEALRPRVHEPERHLVMRVPAVDGILVQVVERVVHPAHVPFEVEAEPAARGRPRHAGPGRRTPRRW